MNINQEIEEELQRLYRAPAINGCEMTEEWQEEIDRLEKLLED